MMAAESTAPINYYEILQCNPSDSIDDIKKSYQQLILKHHPDKKSTSDSMGHGNCDDGGTADIEAFHQIDTAWKLLRDPDQRQKYDAEMKQHRFNGEPIVHANCCRNDFEFDAESQCYLYPCRCGGFFVLPDEFTTPTDDSKMGTSNERIDSDIDEIFIECDECSFVLRLLGEKR